MAYRVFISHSTSDQGLVTDLANLLTKFGVEVFVAERYLAPGEPLDRQVFTQIDRSDCIAVLLTQNGLRSNWVQQEVGFALGKNKPVIPVVEKGSNQKNLAALQITKYIEYDPVQPHQALLNASTYLNSVKLKKEEQQKNLLIGGAILAFLLLLSKEGKK